VLLFVRFVIAATNALSDRLFRFRPRITEPVNQEGSGEMGELAFPLEQIAANALPMKESAKYPTVYHFRGSLRSGQLVYFGCSPGIEWVNAYARKRLTGDRDGLFTGPYMHFGFSIDRGNWSYGEGAPGAGEIRDFIYAMVRRGMAAR